MKLIKRETYLNKLINAIGTQDIKVITGVRRSGKSKMLLLLKEYILSSIPTANIIDIDFNQIKYENLKDYTKLNDYIESHYKLGVQNFVLIDEVQMCPRFEVTINSLHSLEKYDIFVTGSNAFLLSSDLATLFTGRTFSIEIYPFSFREYVQYFEYDNLNEAFEKYFYEGGFAGSYPYRTKEEKYSYIKKDVYETIFIRDLMNKYQIRNKQILVNLCNYMLDNISNLFSANSILLYLNDNKHKVSDKTISKYLNYLCEAFVFYKTYRYDLKGKRYLSTDNKYYLTDHSIKYALLGTRNIDIGRTYENIVYIELLRRGYEVYIGKLYKKEIDFVAIKGSEKIYIQVSSYLEDPNVLERELSPLFTIKDAYPKMVIARTHMDEYDREGIKIIDIVDWLYNY